MSSSSTVRSLSNSEILDRAAKFAVEWCGKSEIVVLAPTKAAADEFLRRACEGGLLGAHALTLTQLAGVLAAPVMADAGLTALTRLGSEAVAARVAHTALKENKLSYFTPVADMPGFARAVARTLTEVRFEGLSAADLRQGGLPGGDLGLLLRLYEQELAERNLADLPGVFSFAGERVRAGAHRLTGVPIVLLDVPIEHELQRSFLVALIERAPAVFAGELAGESTCATSSSLERVRTYLFSADTPAGDASDTDLIFSAPGEGLECVEIARRVRLLADEGTRFDRIAILLRDPEQYQPLLEEALYRAGIPAYFSRGTARPDPAGRAFLALLACAEEGCSASRFAEYLSLGQVPPLDASGAPPRFTPAWVPPEDELFTAAPPVPEPAGETDNATDESAVIAGTLTTPANWEKLLVDAAVIGGYDRWARRLRGLEQQLRMKLAEADGEDPHIERQLAHLRNLERFALPVIEFLHSLPKAALWGEWLERLTELAAMSLRNPESVLAVLNELQPMSDVGPAGLAEVRGVLTERLGTLRREPPRRRYGRVFVGAIDEARGRSFEVVFLPGLAEGIFPRRSFEDPLLLDDRRSSISDRLEGRDERAARERMLLRIAVAAARTKLVVSYPRVNVAQSRPRVPSFYALEVLRAAEGRLPNLREFEKRAARGAPTRLDWPAPKIPEQAIDDAEYDLAWLKAAENRKGAARYLIELEDSRLADSLRTRWRRWDHRKWCSADGIVEPGADALVALEKHRPAARPYSPSSLQQFTSCPYRFYLYAIAQLRPREEPVALEQLDPLTRGSLFHSVQFELMRELDEHRLLPIRSHDLEEVLDIADAVLDRVVTDYEDKLAPAVPRVWKAEIEDIRTDLRGWIQHVASDHPEWQPTHFEFAFGLHDDTPRDPRSSPHDVGIEGLRLRGSIDMIERHMTRNTLRITDHKTGKRPQDTPVHVGGGAILQPILYGLVAERLLGGQVEAGRLFYCTQRGDYSEIQIGLTTEARQRMAAVIEAIDRSIKTGFLPAAPRQGDCGFCDFQSVCGPYEEQRTARKPRQKLDDLQKVRSLP